MFRNLTKPLPPVLMIVWTALVFAVLVVFVVLQKRPPIGDEPLHLEGARLLAQGVPLKTMLLTPLGSAPGPLYQILHATLSRITHFEVPAVRLVNVVLLVVVIGLLAELLRVMGETTLKKRRETGEPKPEAKELQLGPNKPTGVMPVIAGAILAVPIVWQFAGLALTEIPALVFALAACVVWFRGEGWGSAVGAGLLLGVAVCGRQTLLVLVGALLTAGSFNPLNWRREWALVGALLPLPLMLFATWGGLTPPTQNHLSGFSLGNLWLACVWLSVYGLILAPGYLRVISNRWIAGLMLVTVAANLGIGFFPLPVWERVLKYYMSDGGLAFAARWNGGVLAGVAVVFLTATAMRIKRDFSLPETRFWAMAVIAITGTALAIGGHFSPRYPGLAAPFLIGLQRSEISITVYGLARWSAGACLGLVSVGSYF